MPWIYLADPAIYQGLNEVFASSSGCTSSQGDDSIALATPSYLIEMQSGRGAGFGEGRPSGAGHTRQSTAFRDGGTSLHYRMTGRAADGSTAVAKFARRPKQSAAIEEQLRKHGMTFAKCRDRYGLDA